MSEENQGSLSRGQQRSLTMVHIGVAGILGGLIASAVGFISIEHVKKAIIDIATSGTRGNGQTNTPVVVRGGAMTFRTDDSNGWVGSSAPYCANLKDNTYIEFVRVSPKSGPQPIPLALSGLGAHWRLDIFGRDPVNGGSSKTKGVYIQPQSGSCSTGSGPASVLLSPQNDTNEYSALYPQPTQECDIDEDSNNCSAANQPHKSMRFWDKTPTRGATPGCQGPMPSATSATNGIGDEDYCERISDIRLTLDTTAAVPITYVYRCLDGECEIGIGKH
jgi:hypothetical protein